MATSAPMTPPPPGWKPPAMLPGDEPGDWDRAADIAAQYGTTLEHAIEAIRRALNDPAPPAAVYGYNLPVDCRWWERPRRLWRRHAAERTVNRQGIPPEFGAIEIPVKRLPGDPP